ncbi:MAG TPA: hypothetical protein DDY13_08610 [Cytophagales bacterium]|nr:hypothetical protein [Cytophagales bacterium]
MAPLKQGDMKKQYKYLLPIGMLCLAIGMVFCKVGGEHAAVNFLAGLFCGLSIVFALFGLAFWKSEAIQK